MIDLEDFQRRVDAYFQCGQRTEPQGRIILDMMRALRETHAENKLVCDERDAFHKWVEAQRAEIDKLRAENVRLMAQLVEVHSNHIRAVQSYTLERAENVRLKTEIGLADQGKG